MCENAVKNTSKETAQNALIAMRDWNGLENLKNIKTKGEFTLVIGGRIRENNKNANDYDSIRIDLLNLIKAGLSHSSAANYLSKKLKKPKKEIYGLILKK